MNDTEESKNGNLDLPDVLSSAAGSPRRMSPADTKLKNVSISEKKVLYKYTE